MRIDAHDLAEVDHVHMENRLRAIVQLQLIVSEKWWVSESVRVQCNWVGSCK